MTLSICLVTRNHEQLLGRLFHSIAGLGAEVIVADTGSTDGTAAVATALGAKVLVVAWQDDFAAAQNQALAQATGDWVLWLNPDEEILAEGKVQLKALEARSDALAYGVRVREFTASDRLDSYSETWQPRLFRRRPDLRYVGRLHPHFAESLEDLARRESMVIPRADLVIGHHAYHSRLTPEKLRWATRFLELELKDRPGQLHYLIQYGRHLLWLNDPQGHAVLAEAAEQIVPLQNAPAPPTPATGLLLEYLITVAPDQSRSRLAPFEARILAERWFPNSPPILWAIAQKAYRVEDFQEAARHLEKLITLGRTGTYDHSAAFDPSIVADLALLNLGNCQLRLGALNRAEWCYAQVLNHPRYQNQAKKGLEMVKLLQKVSTHTEIG
jgi:hypothetical protein